MGCLEHCGQCTEEWSVEASSSANIKKNSQWHFLRDIKEREREKGRYWTCFCLHP